LLKHRFIKGAKKTSYLTELIDRHERWIAEGNKDSSSSDEDQKSDGEEPGESWDFGTVNAKSNQGKAMAAVSVFSLSFASNIIINVINVIICHYHY
jgi:serine/threonine-protein kinase 24/25/MST4